MQLRKEFEDLVASRNVIAGNMTLFRAGNEDAYRVIAVELRKLLCDGKAGRDSLVPRIFKHPVLHPHRNYRPGENLADVVFLQVGLWDFGSHPPKLVELFDLSRTPIPLTEWLNQPFLSGTITIQDFIRSVADRQGAHADKTYNATLELARTVRIPSTTFAGELMIAIGGYVLSLLEGAIRRLRLTDGVVPPAQGR